MDCGTQAERNSTDMQGVISLLKHADHDENSTDTAAQRLLELLEPAEHTAGGNASAVPRGRCGSSL